MRISCDSQLWEFMRPTALIPEATTDLGTILACYPQLRPSLIPILQDVQTHFGHVTPESVRAIARHVNVSEHDVFGVATFFSQFRFNPPGRHCLKVCEGTACHVRGSAMLVSLIDRTLHIAPGQTTDDREFSVERVMCLGSCALAPVVVSDDKVHGRVTQKQLEKWLKVKANEGTSNDVRSEQAGSRA
jgi:NADH-quinone oxidoreductase subunit E